MKKFCKNIFYFFKYSLKTSRIFISNSKRRIILFNTPEHGNLGDHAIVFAEQSFFQDYMKEYEFIEISSRHFLHNKRFIFSRIKQTDIICITGGGFLGDLWKMEQEIVFQIIKQLPKNKIVILPQTIYYKKNNWHNKEIIKAKQIYAGHNNLSICLRDQQSFEIATRYFFDISEIIYIPDMVLYLNESNDSILREGILLCLRTDKESIICKKDKDNLLEKLSEFNEKFSETTTVLPYFVNKERREKELKKKFREFKGAKLVITDRLHAMLFAAITGTPCIALDNVSGKVKGVYEWIKYLNYIKFCSDVSLIDFWLKSKFWEEKFEYSNTRLHKYFFNLKELLLK